MRRTIPFLLAAVLGVLAAALVACGGTNPHLIPSDDASQLQDEVAAIGDAVASGQCDQLEPAIQQAQSQLRSLPSSVSVRLKARIEQGIAHLRDIGPQECRRNGNTQTQDTTTTETTPTVTTPTTTTPTVTTPTTTTPTVTTPTTTTPTTTTQTTTTPTQTAPSTTTTAPPPGTGGQSAPGSGWTGGGNGGGTATGTTG